MDVTLSATRELLRTNQLTKLPLVLIALILAAGLPPVHAKPSSMHAKAPSAHAKAPALLSAVVLLTSTEISNAAVAARGSTSQHNTAHNNTAHNNTAQHNTARHDALTNSLQQHLQLGANAVSEHNLYWQLAEATASQSGFDANARWLELYVEPGLSFTHAASQSSAWFGSVSAVASYSAGTDAFAAGDTGRLTLEEAFIGYRQSLNSAWQFEASLGPRVFKLGSGMLIANGGADGFERGALKFGPREAWEMAGILTLSNTSTALNAFYLDANEITSSDSHNRLAGVDLRWSDAPIADIGLTYLKVVRSTAPYPQAPNMGIGAPSILDSGRHQLQTVNLYGAAQPIPAAPNFSINLDLAYQWRKAIDLRASAGRLKMSYQFLQPWQPVLAYSFQLFSGDDPATTELERFDPLYYDGSPNAWATGSKSAMVFINSNVLSHQLSIRLQPKTRHIVTLRYAHVRAHQLNSPIQFGQATRLDFIDGVSSVITGVTDAHLSDDFFIEYNHIVNRNLYLNAGVSVSFPGDGIKQVTQQDTPNWKGAFLNVVYNY